MEKLKSFMKKMDKNCRIFLFGSAAKGEYSLLSDIDILILTKLKANEVIGRLRRASFDEPFEFHVVDERRFEMYERFIKELKEIK